MAYIWINPVVDSMYEPDVLNAFLHSHGYERVEASRDWPAIVKDKYRLAVCQTTKTVVDVRCPKVVDVLEEAGGIDDVFVPEIPPILIHCGQEMSEHEDLQDEEKIVITPCQALADMGNKLGLTDTWFVPWNQFVESLGGGPKGIEQEKSPIPPGFFDGLNLKTVSVTGEDEIRNYFEKQQPDSVQLIEMLFCKEGCHNGDGIRKCEE